MSSKNSSSPLVSIVIPAYNGALTIDRAIKSILKQTYTNYEVIVVDDGSSDSTPEILRRYKSRYGSKFTIVTQENRGCLAARENGIKRAGGDYIALLDQDDWWVPNKLAIQVDIMRKSPQIGLTFGNLAAVDMRGKSLGFTVVRKGERHTPSWEELLCIFPLYPSSSLIRRELFDMVKYDPRFGLSGAYGDQDFHIRLREVTDFHFFNGKLGFFCWHAGVAGAEMFLPNLLIFAEKYWNYEKLLTESSRPVRERFLLAIEAEVRDLFRRLLNENGNVADENLLGEFVRYSERMSQVLYPDYGKVSGSARIDLAKFQLDKTLSTLLYLYLCRRDLQEIFPEVSDGELSRYMGWAYKVARGSCSDYDGAIFRQFRAQLEIRFKEGAVQCEVNAIRTGPIYSLVSRCLMVLDKLMPGAAGRGGIKGLVIGSLRFIDQNGFRAFGREAVRRIRARIIRPRTTALLQIKSIEDLKKTRHNYSQRMENEKRFYSQLERTEAGMEKGGAALLFTLDAFQRRVEKAIGCNVWDYVIECVNNRNFTRILSLGAGTCGLEISLAGRFQKPYEFACIEFNKELMDQGIQMARAKGISIKPLVQDINFLKLDEMFDVVFAHAVLHHLVELEHIMNEIKLHLSPEGQFIVYDVTARNGLLLWPEQRKVIDGLLKALPPKFCYSHFLKKNTDTFVEIDHSDTSFECIRSQDVLPLLQKCFATIRLVKGFSFVRRFTDNEFGPNFDLSQDIDLKVLNFLLELDQWYVDNGLLEPESVFWVGRRPD